jgi:hypothetical protein
MEILTVNEKLVKGYHYWTPLLKSVVEVCMTHESLNKDYFESFRRMFDAEYKEECRKRYIKHIFANSILGLDIAELIIKY